MLCFRCAIQIAKALSSKARYILMDEPTSSLTIHEANNLISIIYRLKEENVCVIFISHKIEETLEACDVITVLRDGKYVGKLECAHATRQDVVTLMIGRNENTNHFGFLNIQNKPVLEIKNFSSYGKFGNVNLQLNKGEILGLYGLVGSGRTELARLIIGVDEKNAGEVFINGKKAQINSFADSIYKYRLGYVTENRKEEGLMLDASISDNISITVWNRILNRFKK
jgi:ribose transport system ATP-binding protein